VIGFLRGQPINPGTQPTVLHPRRNLVAPTRVGRSITPGATDRGYVSPLLCHKMRMSRIPALCGAPRGPCCLWRPCCAFPPMLYVLRTLDRPCVTDALILCVSIALVISYGTLIILYAHALVSAAAEKRSGCGGRKTSCGEARGPRRVRGGPLAGAVRISPSPDAGGGLLKRMLFGTGAGPYWARRGERS